MEVGWTIGGSLVAQKPFAENHHGSIDPRLEWCMYLLVLRQLLTKTAEMRFDPNAFLDC